MSCVKINEINEYKNVQPPYVVAFSLLTPKSILCYAHPVRKRVLITERLENLIKPVLVKTGRTPRESRGGRVV